MKIIYANEEVILNQKDVKYIYTGPTFKRQGVSIHPVYKTFTELYMAWQAKKITSIYEFWKIQQVQTGWWFNFNLQSANYADFWNAEYTNWYNTRQPGQISPAISFSGDNITVNNRYIGSFYINGSLPTKECSVVVNIVDNDLYGSTKHSFDLWNVDFKLVKTYADGTEYLSR